MNFRVWNDKILLRSAKEHLEKIKPLVAQFSHKKKEILPSTSFESLGIDSYEVVDLLMLIEEQCNVYIDEGKMLELKTVQDVLDVLDKCSQEEN